MLLLGAVGLPTSAGTKVESIEQAQLQSFANSTAHKVALPLLGNATTVATKSVAPGVAIQTVQLEDGTMLKRLSGKPVASRKISPNKSLRTLGATPVSESEPLNEGFESADGTLEWVPEGWTRESKLEITSEDDAGIPQMWQASEAMMFIPAPSGTYYELINYSVSEKDEWLITPEVKIPQYGRLFFKSFVDPLFLFNLDYMDWEEWLLTEEVCAATLQVLVKESDAQEWTVIKDYFEDWKGVDPLEMETPGALEQESLSLEAFEGKTVQIAFRYVGKDGNTSAIDDVKVGMPEIEVSYSQPAGTLFFGVDTAFTGLSYQIPVGPVNTPLTWTNTTATPDVSFTWMYHSAALNDYDFAFTTDLTETYAPDYSSAFTRRNNLYYTPVLMGSAPGASDGMASYYDYYQAGGRAEFELTNTATGEKSVTRLNMLPFELNTEGFQIATAENSDGDTFPLYGYSPLNDDFWTFYTFHGENLEGEGAKVTGIFNTFLTPSAPLVIDGIIAHAKGQVKAEAEFTIDVIPLSEEGLMLDPIATAKLKGSELITIPGGGIQDFYVLPFSFETPAVMSTEICEMFIVRLSGFNDPENVTYFIPFQSTEDNPYGMAIGWVEKEITMGGETVSSVTPTAYYSGYHAFAIALDAYYPWLDCDTETVEIAQDSEATVAMGTFHHADDMTVTTADGEALPEWLEVTLSGQHDTATATFSGKGENPATCAVKIAAPGVEKTFNVSYMTSGISGITAPTASPVKEAFNLSGQRVDFNSALPAGVYILRHMDGTVSKRTVK